MSVEGLKLEFVKREGVVCNDRFDLVLVSDIE